MSEHFALVDFLHSEVARLRGIENVPTWQVVDNLVRLADTMERVRAILNVPITITSGFRCPALNSAVGGAGNSAHLYGLACDFVAPAFGDVTDIVQIIQPAMLDLGIDQLIHEAGWVHLGLAIPPGKPRHECFKIP